MALLLCIKVGDGLRPAEATVTVEEHDGRHQFLPIDRGMIAESGGQKYLSVSVIHRDPAKDVVLVALPVEADSGASRIWVKSNHVKFKEKITA